MNAGRRWSRTLARSAVAAVVLSLVSAGAAHAAPDLDLTLSPTTLTKKIGESATTVTATVTYDDDGNGPANAVVFFSVPPSVSLTESEADYANGQWTLNGLTDGANRQIQLQIAANTAGPLGASPITGVLTSNAPETAFANNLATLDFTASPGEVQLTTTAPAITGQAEVDGAVTLRANVANGSSTTAAKDVLVSAPLPAGIAFSSKTTNCGSSYAEATGIWTIPTVGVSASCALSLSGKVIAPGTHTFTATRIGLSSLLSDTGGANAASSQITVPTPAPTTVTQVVTQTTTVQAPPVEQPKEPTTPKWDPNARDLTFALVGRPATVAVGKKVKLVATLAAKDTPLAKGKCEKLKVKVAFTVGRYKYRAILPFSGFDADGRTCEWTKLIGPFPAQLRGLRMAFNASLDLQGRKKKMTAKTAGRVAR